MARPKAHYTYMLNAYNRIMNVYFDKCFSIWRVVWMMQLKCNSDLNILNLIPILLKIYTVFVIF